MYKIFSLFCLVMAFGCTNEKNSKNTRTTLTRAAVIKRALDRAKRNK